ncbi:MAG: hypothetical protein HYU74_03130 [Dechloromonas sp.]|nr:hypothetical protein [Dechloromonas sp.]
MQATYRSGTAPLEIIGYGTRCHILYVVAIARDDFIHPRKMEVKSKN